MKEQGNASSHPLFNMEFEDDTDVNIPGSEESAEEVDKRVDALLADQGIVDPETEQTTTAPAATVADPSTTTGDPEIDGYSQPALTALFFQKSHGTIGADVVIPKDLTPDGLQDLLIAGKVAKEQVSEEEKTKQLAENVKARLAAEGLTKEDFEMLAHLKRGGSGEVVSRYMELKEMATEKVETEEEMLETIKFAAELAGQKPEYVDAYIANNLMDPEEIKKAFVEAQKTIGAEADRQYQADRQRIEQVAKAEEERWTSFTAKVKELVPKGVKGITFSKADQEELIDYMTNKKINVDVMVKGQKVRKPITAYEEFGRKLQKDMEENIAFAYYSMKGSAGMVNAASQTANDKFLAAAASQHNKTLGARKAAQPVMDDLEGEIVTSMRFG